MKRHPILITEDVYARANGGVMVSEFCAQHVKGRSAAVRVYGVDEVRGESGAWLAWKTADADATQTRGAREGRG